MLPAWMTGPRTRSTIALLLPFVVAAILWRMSALPPFAAAIIFTLVVYAGARLADAAVSLAAFALSGLLLIFFILPPHMSILIHPEHRWAAFTFLFVGALTLVGLNTRRKGMAALDEKNTLLHAFVEQGLAGMCTVKNGILHSANPELVHMFGYDSADQVVGRPIVDFFTDAEQARAFALAGADTTEELSAFQDVYRAVRRDGSEFDMEIRASVRDVKGESVAFAIVLDVTDRVQVERELRDKQALWDRAAHIGKVGVFQIDLPSLEMKWSDEAWAIHGIEPQEPFFVQDAENILCEESRGKPFMALQRTLETGEPWDVEVDTITPKGEHKWIGMHGEAVEENGRIVRLEGTVRDITEERAQAAAIIESEERFRAIFEQSPDGIFINALDGRYLDANPAALAMFGYTREELLALSTPDLLIPEVRDRVAATFVPSEQPTTFQGELLRKDGSRFVGETLVKLLHNGQLLAVIRDISESHAADVALRESEERYRAIVEQAPDGIFVADGTGTLLDVNDAGCTMLGYTREQLIGASIPDIIVEDEIPGIAAEFERLDAVGKSHRNWLFRRSDGSVFVGEVQSRKLSDGRLQALIRDVTERQRREQQIRDAKERLELATEAAGLGVWEAIDGVVTVDARAAELFALSTGAGVASQAEVTANIHPDDLAWLRSTDPDVLVHGETLVSEFRVVHPDGSVHWLVDYRRKVGESGIERTHVVGVCSDITMRKRAEAELRELNVTLERRVASRTAELEDTNKELEAFTYAVSHDLRAPLRRMSGLCDALEQDYGSALDDTGKHFMHLITEEATQSSSLIEGLLELSRSSRGEIRRTVVDISAMADSLLTRLQTTDPDRDVAVEVERGLSTCGDRRMIESLMTNLLDNAWKYTCCDMSARIEVYAERGDGHDWICVRDNGAGFDPRYAENLFVPFQRLHSDDEFKGVGIGLATVNRIVRRHGGEIRAVGEVGKGATFSFWLPAADEL